MNEKIKDDLTYSIIDCAMKVHAYLGNGFQEVIYQRALAIEMAQRELQFVREASMSIHYEGHYLGTRRVDFFVEDKVMLELKAIIKMDESHLAQGINYLEAFGIDLGLLINFGPKAWR